VRARQGLRLFSSQRLQRDQCSPKLWK